MPSVEPVLRLEGITKVYQGTVANRDISFDLHSREIHALCGENGAGKSTLMKILFGMETPSKGQILLKGKPIRIDTPQAAIDLGIGMVHQHFMLVPSFTVAENLVLGIEPARLTRINKREASRITREIGEKFNLPVTPDAKVEDITIAMMQKVEILKALYRGAKILILDEPTAVLTPQETEELFGQLLSLKEQGHTIVFISHKLNEVKRVSDRITVLRKGLVTGRFNTSEVNEEEITRAMMGNLKIQDRRRAKPDKGGDVLVVSHICSESDGGAKSLDNVSFSVRRGEILGVAGVEGNGQADLVRALTGRLRLGAGEIRMDNNQVTPSGLSKVRALGVSYIPEDRIKDGCALGGSVWENLITNRLFDSRFVKRALLQKKSIDAQSEELVADYHIQCSDIHKQVSSLSGGNIQKVVVARECSIPTRLLIADQPTRGIDVGAAARIHDRILEMSRQGTAVLMISADLTELLRVCSRLIVFFEGRVTACFQDMAALEEQELGYYMLGLKRQEVLHGL